jgi:hypothetical protein
VRSTHDHAATAVCGFSIVGTLVHSLILRNLIGPLAIRLLITKNGKPVAELRAHAGRRAKSPIGLG